MSATTVEDWRDDVDEARRALGEIRSTIEYVDMILLDVITRRAQLVSQAHELKERHGLPVRDPAREAVILGRVCAGRQGYDAKTVAAVFQALFDGCERLGS